MSAKRGAYFSSSAARVRSRFAIDDSSRSLNSRSALPRSSSWRFLISACMRRVRCNSWRASDGADLRAPLSSGGTRVQLGHLLRTELPEPDAERDPGREAAAGSDSHRNRVLPLAGESDRHGDNTAGSSATHSGAMPRDSDGTNFVRSLASKVSAVCCNSCHCFAVLQAVRRRRFARSILPRRRRGRAMGGRKSIRRSAKVASSSATRSARSLICFSRSLNSRRGRCFFAS